MAFTVTRINPTENDVGGTETGRVIKEANWRSQFRRNFEIVSGWTYAVNTPGNLQIEVTAGTAIIDGMEIVATGTQAITVSASVWWRLFLAFTEDGSGRVTGLALQKTEGSTAVVADAITLAHGRAGPTQISDDFDMRPRRGVHAGSFDTTLATPDDGGAVVLNYRPSAVAATNGDSTTWQWGYDYPLGSTTLRSPTNDGILIQAYGFSRTGQLGGADGKFLAWR